MSDHALDALRAEIAASGQAGGSSDTDVRMPDRDWPPAEFNRSVFAPKRGLARVWAAIRRRVRGRRPRAPGDIFYNAPHLVVLGIDDRGYAEYSAFDAGLYAQTLCLAAQEHGVGSCILAQAVKQPDALRRILPAAQDTRFLVAIALGYADPKAAVNRGRRSRAPLDELVNWTARPTGAPGALRQPLR